jgi:replicative DNA helicase
LIEEFDLDKEGTVIDLSKYDGEDRVVTSQELERRFRDRQINLVYYKSAFPTLNDLIGGFTGGELIVISGVTKNGKTLLAQTFTVNFANSDLGVLWFTYEVPMIQFLSQFGQPLPLFYMPNLLKGRSMDWIHNRIKEAVVKYKVKAVFIDHLHYLADIMTKSNPSLEIGRVMRTLKAWAVELDIMVFIIAHTGKIYDEREPQTGDTRDSSFVEQEADNVFYIWRIKTAENQAYLKITANRGRGVMNKKIKLIKHGKYLVELTPGNVEGEEKPKPKLPYKEPKPYNKRKKYPEDDDFGREED